MGIFLSVFEDEVSLPDVLPRFCPLLHFVLYTHSRKHEVAATGGELFDVRHSLWETAAVRERSKTSFPLFFLVFSTLPRICFFGPTITIISFDVVLLSFVECHVCIAVLVFCLIVPLRQYVVEAMKEKKE